MADNDYEYEIKSAHYVNPSILNNKWRVKLYHLNLLGQWDDMGTGHVSIHKEEPEYYIKMTSETNNEVMFELKLIGGLDFHRQRGTILTWKSKKEEEDDDTAVSFQEKDGIREVWRFICMLKGADPQEELYEMDEEDDEILPEPTVENLSYLAREIRPEMPPNKALKVLDYISLNKGMYIRKLGDVMEAEEKKLEEKKSEITKTTADENEAKNIEWSDQKNSQIENLSLIFTIFKNIFFIADQNAIELLLSEEIYMTTFGALEYDFESQKIIKHRNFFKETSKFKNILNIDDPALISKIHLNHRLSYLRDTAIGRFIEEMTIKHINIMLHYNNSDIVQYFLNNKTLLKKVIDTIQNESLNEKNDAILFLLELIICCKDLIQTRFYFYECLCELNTIEALEKTLVDVTHYSDYNTYFKSLKEDSVSLEDQKEDSVNTSLTEKIKINTIEILINILTVVPTILKSYIISKHQKNKEHPLLSELCNILIHRENFGIKFEIGEILKSLLDHEVTEKKNEFYDLFYNKCLKKLVDFIEIPTKEEFKYEMNSSKQIIIEILCHCLKQHEQRVRYWIIHNDLISKVVLVLENPSKILQLQVIKFFKSVLMNNDENLNKIIINNDYFSQILKVFENNSKKDNLVLSAILDLFEFMKKQNIKKIISYLFEKHYDVFYDASNRKFFAGLVTRYENNLDQFSSNKVTTENEEKLFSKYPGWANREIAAKEDENYFNDSDDDIFKKEGELNDLHSEEEDFDFINLAETYKKPDDSQDFLRKKVECDSDIFGSFAEESEDISNSIKKKRLDDDE